MDSRIVVKNEKQTFRNKTYARSMVIFNTTFSTPGNEELWLGTLSQLTFTFSRNSTLSTVQNVIPIMYPQIISSAASHSNNCAIFTKFPKIDTKHF